MVLVVAVVDVTAATAGIAVSFLASAEAGAAAAGSATVAGGFALSLAGACVASTGMAAWAGSVAKAGADWGRSSEASMICVLRGRLDSMDL